MNRALRICVIAVAICALAAWGGASSAPTDADAAFSYKKCGSFKYKGKHTLFTHRYPCRKAKRKARYVLKHRHRPPHWSCSLAELSSGFAACQRGKRAWEFTPG
jgi:hypothetical protein